MSRNRHHWLSKKTNTLLTLDGDQLGLVKTALALYVDCLIGNFSGTLKSELSANLYYRYRESKNKKMPELLDEESVKLGQALIDLETIMCPDRVGMGPRVLSDKTIREEVRIAWDIHEVITEWIYGHTVLRVSKEHALPGLQMYDSTWEDFLEFTQEGLVKLGEGVLPFHTQAPENIRAAVLDAAKVLKKCLRKTSTSAKTSE